MDRDRTAEVVLEAAALLVNDEGAEAITIEAISAATEIDEAAIREIFPDIAALTKAVATRVFSSFLEMVEAEIGDDDRPGAFTRAYVRAADAEANRENFTRLGVALLGSGPYRPELVDFVRREQATLRAAFEDDGIDPTIAAIVRLSADGLWMNGLFAFEPVTPERRAAVTQRLLELASPPEAPEVGLAARDGARIDGRAAE